MTFVNYFRNDERSSPLNLAVARVLVGIYSLWKVTTYLDWGVVAEWPVYLHREYQSLVLSEGLWYLPFERALVVLVLLLFTVGYRIRVTGFLAALLLSHLSALLNMVTTGGTATTYLYPVYLLLLVALFADDDVVSVDGLRRTRFESLAELNDTLQESTDRSYRMRALKWSLLAFGIIYFQSGIIKVVEGPLWAWATWENLARYLVLWVEASGRELVLAEIVAESPVASGIVAVSTIALEVGFVVAIVAGLPLTPFVLGLLAMHTGIAVAMTPFFFDMYVLYLVFVPWDDLYSRLASDRAVHAVYDEHCYFCVRSLQFVNWLDVNDTVTFVPGEDRPEELSDVDPTDAMYLVTDDGVYRGYHAFRRLFRHFRVFLPVALVMAMPGVRTLGERTYELIAENRTRYFACAIDSGA